MGRLKSWAKVYEADRKSLWKPLSSQVSGHILYVQRWNECGGSSCYSEKIWWQKGPLKHLCTLMKSKKEKKPENTQNDGLLAMKPGHAAVRQQPLMQLWRGPLQLHIHFPGLRQKTHTDWLWQWHNFYHFPTKHHRSGFELSSKKRPLFQGLQVNNLINRFVVSNAWKKPPFQSITVMSGAHWHPFIICISFSAATLRPLGWFFWLHTYPVSEPMSILIPFHCIILNPIFTRWSDGRCIIPNIPCFLIILIKLDAQRTYLPLWALQHSPNLSFDFDPSFLSPHLCSHAAPLLFSSTASYLS